MSILKNIKHEAFADEYVNNGGVGRSAYQNVYPKTKDAAADAAASRLLRNVKVSARIDELKSVTEQKCLITRESLIKEIDEVAALAKAEGQMSVAMKGIELKGKMIAAFTEKQEHSGPNGGPIETEQTTIQILPVKAKKK